MAYLAGFQPLEQRDKNDSIVVKGVVSKESPFSTSDNTGIYDIIAENLRCLYEQISSVVSDNNLASIRDEIKKLHDSITTDTASSRTEAKAQAQVATEQANNAVKQANIATAKVQEVTNQVSDIRKISQDISGYILKINTATAEANECLSKLEAMQKDIENERKTMQEQVSQAKTYGDNAKLYADSAASAESNSKYNTTVSAQNKDGAKKFSDEAKEYLATIKQKASEVESNTAVVQALLEEVVKVQSSFDMAYQATIADNELVKRELAQTIQEVSAAKNETTTCASSFAKYNEDAKKYSNEAKSYLDTVEKKANEVKLNANAVQSALTEATSIRTSINSAYQKASAQFSDIDILKTEYESTCKNAVEELTQTRKEIADAKKKNLLVTLDPLRWSLDREYTIKTPYVTEDSNIIMEADIGTTETVYNVVADAHIVCREQKAGYFVLKCLGDVPDQAVNVRFLFL